MGEATDSAVQRDADGNPVDVIGGLRVTDNFPGPFGSVTGLLPGTFSFFVSFGSSPEFGLQAGFESVSDNGILDELRFRVVDPVTGRPLGADAPPGSACSDGSASQCFHAGDPIPNQAAFDALCDWDRQPSFDCWLERPNDQTNLNAANPLAPTRATLETMILRGNTLARGFASSASGDFLNPNSTNYTPFVVNGVDFSTVNDIPFVPSSDVTASGLHAGTADGPSNSVPVGHASAAVLNTFQAGVASALSDAQEALLGGGSFWDQPGFASVAEDQPIPVGEGGLDINGLGLLESEISVLTEAWPADPNARTDLDTIPQPGTVGAIRSVAQRRVGDSLTTLPGARAIDDPGYDPLVDGCVGSASDVLATAGIDLASVPNISACDGAPLLLHPFTSQLFASELAAASWNLLVAEVIRSILLSNSSPIPSDGFLASEPLALDRCSLLRPQLCYRVLQWIAHAPKNDPDSPVPPNQRHWLWERGAQFDVSGFGSEYTKFNEAFAFGLVQPDPLTLESFGGPIFVPILLRPACRGADLDADGTPDVCDNCPSIPNPDQNDRDSDRVGDLCDNCVEHFNPNLSPPSFRHSHQTTTGNQLDDDADGHGNRCDAKFGTPGQVVGGTDLLELRSSFNRNRAGSDCGIRGNKNCSQFDLDGNGTFIGGQDWLLAFGLFNEPPGPKCPTCPLECQGPGCGCADFVIENARASGGDGYYTGLRTHFEVVNRGTCFSGPASHTVLVTKGYGYGEVIGLRSVHTFGLFPGQRAVYDEAFPISSYPPPTVDVTFRADVGNQVNETDETNNVVTLGNVMYGASLLGPPSVRYAMLSLVVIGFLLMTQAGEWRRRAVDSTRPR